MAEEIPERPRLQRGLSLVPIGDGVALLCSAERTLRLRGEGVEELLGALCPLLDGRHTLAEIRAAMEEDDFDDVDHALMALAAEDLLESVDEEESESDDDKGHQWSEVFNRAAPGARKPSQAQVLVVGEAGEKRGNLFQRYVGALTEMGVAAVRQAKPNPALAWADIVTGCDLVMFMPDQPSLKARDALQAACLKAGVKFSRAELLNTSLLAVGPTVVPGETACWTCYEHRVKGVQDHFREVEAFQMFLRAHPEVDPVGSRLPVLTQMLASLAALETMRILTDAPLPMTYGAVLTLNAATCSLERHDVLKLPRCPACSPVRQDPPRRIWPW